MSFAKTSLGPITSGVDTDKGALVVDVLNGVVEMVRNDGNMQALQTALFISNAQTALTTITTAQTLGAISAGGAGAFNKLKRAILISGTGIFSTAGTPQITLAIVMGGVTLCSIQTPAIANAQTNGQFAFSFFLTVVSTGTAGTIEAHGTLSVQGGASLAAAVPTYMDQNTAVSAAVNLVTSGSITLQIASTVTLTSAQLRQAAVEIVN